MSFANHYNTPSSKSWNTYSLCYPSNMRLFYVFISLFFWLVGCSHLCLTLSVMSHYETGVKLCFDSFNYIWLSQKGTVTDQSQEVFVVTQRWMTLWWYQPGFCFTQAVVYKPLSNSFELWNSFELSSKYKVCSWQQDKTFPVSVFIYIIIPIY